MDNGDSSSYKFSLVFTVHMSVIDKCRNNVVQKRSKLSTLPPSLMKRKWVFLVWIILLQILSVATALLQGLYLNSWVVMGIVSLLFYVISEALICIFFIRTARRVLRCVKGLSTMDHADTIRVRNQQLFVMLICIR
jgi:hypothetical protein